MPWVAVCEIAKALGVSPEKAGWLMRRLGLRRRRVKGRSQWFIEPELLPDELRLKLLPLMKTVTNQRDSSNPATRTIIFKTATHGRNCYSRESTFPPSKKLLKIIYDYLKHNYPVVEKGKLKDVLQGLA